jgi:uncharacterized protein YijF (DUF1287 family)
MKHKKIMILIIFLFVSAVSILAIDKIFDVKILKCISDQSFKKSNDVNSNIKNGIYTAAMNFANTTTWVYDPSYYKITYPNGDVPSGGACTDLVIRVLRKNNLDLQQLIHEDMISNFSAYPKKWGLNKPDANIDHRRVPNIMTYFKRQRYDVAMTTNGKDYLPGDIVCWELSPGVTHIGIVLENQDVFHNMGPTSRIESDFLFSHKIIGHYRI